jgi:hypothetical protein
VRADPQTTTSSEKPSEGLEVLTSLNHVSATYNHREHQVMLDRANDLLERTNKLDDAVCDLQAFRSLLEDLNARSAPHLPPLELSRQQTAAVVAVRAAILRAAIALAVAMLDSRGRDRFSLGQIVELLKDTRLVEFFLNNRGHHGTANAMSEKLQKVCNAYKQTYTGQRFQRVQQLRHDRIGHLLMRVQPTPTSDHFDVFAIIDEIEGQVITLHEGLGMLPPNFNSLKKHAVQQAKLFWDSYFAGVAALS